MIVMHKAFSQTSEVQKTCLSFLNLSCRSARSKVVALDLFLHTLNFDFSVIILTETWYNQESEMFTPSLYFRIFVTRDNKRGGGVSLLVCRTYECYLESEFSAVTDNYETIAICHGKHMYIGLHRPPDGCLNTLCAFLECMFIFAIENNVKLVVGGDFNANLLGSDTKESHLSSFFSINGFDISTGATSN